MNEKQIEKSMKRDNIDAQIKKGNELNSKKKEYDENTECEEPAKKQSPVEDMSSKNSATTQEEPIYENIKSSAIGSMYSRHEDAANIMRDSVEAIHENVKVSANINNEIDEISAELDKLLSEIKTWVN